MAALATRMVWPASVTTKSFTINGRVYTYAPVLDVLAADVTAAGGDGLVSIGPSGAVAQNGAAGLAGTLGAPAYVPPGGQAGLPEPQTAPDPNRPTGQSAGTLYVDAALRKVLVSDGQHWFDVVTGDCAGT